MGEGWDMKPIPVLLLGAAVARVLWWLPGWVTVALLAALVAAAVGEGRFRRWRAARRRSSTPPDPEPAAEWEDCDAEFRNPDGNPTRSGSFFRCVERKGHAGAHVADRSSIYWAS